MKYIKLYENWNKDNEPSEDKLFLNEILNKYRTPFNEENSITSKGLKKSLEMIGDGTIEEKGSYGDKFMYKEDFQDGEYFIIVHGNISKPMFRRGYNYEIALYENRPSTSQIGGGYGASGIITKNHPKHFHEFLDSENEIFSDEALISNVCKELIPYLKEKYFK